MSRLLEDDSSCRSVLRKLATVPCLSQQGGFSVASGGVAVGALVGGAGARSAGRCEHRGSVLRVLTWNIAGGLRSAQAPEKYSAEDQRAAVAHLSAAT